MPNKNKWYQLRGSHPEYPGMLGWIEESPQNTELIMFYNAEGQHPRKICVRREFLIELGE
jgi:hypothetical protein